MWSKLASIFGFGGVADTALKIAERLTGVDDSPDKKRAFFLEYLAITKNQSVARRFIAISITVSWLTMVLSWLVASAVGRFVYDEAINPGTVLAADISAFMSLNISNPMNIVIGFYFATQILSGFKK